jgi:Arc/MetJ-type ribon-helix-helix transcriptional regulator
MKVSVSLPGEDVAFLDAYAETHALRSRSAAVHHAIRSLRLGELSDAYGQAWAEWESAGEGERWEPSVGDGL